ncbi:hypothetical protein [Pseudomonas sp.]|uniref:hypothetical protein n=1 Tax=Pseudomonas sp. TaxID=306 RepID=UPI003A96C2B6
MTGPVEVYQPALRSACTLCSPSRVDTALSIYRLPLLTLAQLLSIGGQAVRWAPYTTFLLHKEKPQITYMIWGFGIGA